ncbi:MAG: hypothetical protein K5879_01015 [Lachnospiraceae bacterium]|nr:hypothetical protein [Lachnospiraceae bacterium]
MKNNPMATLQETASGCELSLGGVKKICSRLREIGAIQAGIKNVYLRVGKGVGEYKVVPAEKLLWVVGDTD